MKAALTCLFLAPLLLWAQDDKSTVERDSIEKVRAMNRRIYAAPRRASIMSAVVPGLGQIYNRKYWKLPIIYGGLGAFGYLFMINNDEYQSYRRNLVAIYDGDPATVNKTPYSAEQLQSQKAYYKRFRDLSAIGMGVIYILNIIDANVDAHLRTFDVSDDLSLKIRPWIPPTAYGAGISLTLRIE